MKKFFIFLTFVFLINSQPPHSCKKNKFRGIIAGLFTIISGSYLWRSIFSISMKTNCDSTSKALWGFPGVGYNQTLSLKSLANNLSFNVCDGALDVSGFFLPLTFLGVFLILHLELKRLEHKIEFRDQMIKRLSEAGRPNPAPSNPEHKEAKTAIDMPD